MKTSILYFIIFLLFSCGVSKEIQKIESKCNVCSYRAEKDAIAFLGLLSVAYKQFDPQIIHKDGEMTHTKGLNIYAAIIDNRDGELVGQNRNLIHTHTNPMSHAEQMTLRDAIDRMNKKNPRDMTHVSVENYYRNYLFNDLSGDYLNAGNTLYTTLEPCPFCTTALFVSRMKRIVYIIPDKKFGGAFPLLKEKYWDKSNAQYEQLHFPKETNSKIVSFAAKKYSELLANVENTKKENPKYSDAYLLDKELALLKEVHSFFLTIKDTDLITTGEDKEKSVKLLKGFADKLK